MDRFLRPSGAAYFVVAAVFIGVLAGFPSWAAKNSAKATPGATQVAVAAVPAAPKPPAADQPAGANSATAHKETLARGKQMYAQYCASCHGDAGKGDGPGGANLAVKPQDLSVGAVMNPLPDQFLHRIIADGPQSVGLSALMPPFRPQLGDRQISEIIAYIRTLAQPAYDPTKVLPVTATREGPVQPIFFSHVIHTGSYQIACQYCHAGARRSSAAGVPSVEMCMGCHKIVAAQGNPEVQKLLGYWERKEPIPWVRIFKVPEHAQFAHKQHVQAGMQCQTCHGRVEAMERVHAETGQNIINDLLNLALVSAKPPKLTMGWCVECHRTVNAKGVQGVQTAADAPIPSVHVQPGTESARRNAPLECVTCHH